MVESERRARYYSFLRSHRTLDPGRADPRRSHFDPLLASILKLGAGDLDEASWLVFLAVHFGRNRRTGWSLARDVYGAAGGAPWTWDHTSANVSSFRTWLAANESALRNGPPRRHFGNHRKYQSLSAFAPTGTGAAVESYVDWVRGVGGHGALFRSAIGQASGDGRLAFHLLFESMNAVASFGRTARFDYLTTIGKLSIAPLEPGSLYLSGATGPLSGARLLFGAKSVEKLDECAVRLAHDLVVPMHVLEDALCNWQKSPAKIVRFRG